MSLVWFIVLIGLLITVHELGHLVAARLLDIRVLKLSIGFGPTLASFTRRGTEYAISAIPLGGYVRLLGEDRADDVPARERPRSFSHRPAWQRLVVILAGPAANLVFPVFIFAHLYARQTTARAAVIGAVLPGQPAADADLRPGDRVIAIDDSRVRYWDEFNAKVLSAPGRELRVTVERPGHDRPLTKVVTPRPHLRTDAFGARERVGLLGVTPHFRVPQIGVVDERSAAWQAGLRTFDVITSIHGRAVQTAADLEPLLAPRSGAMMVVTYLRPRPGLGAAQVTRLEPGTAQIVPHLVTLPSGARRYDAGLRPADLFIFSVEPNTPAARLGLQPGDILVALDGVPLTCWEVLQQTLEEHPDEEHVLVWRSGDAERTGRFNLERRRSFDEYQSESTLFVFGAEGARATLPVPEEPLDRHIAGAIGKAVGRAVGATGMLVRVLGLMLAGKLPATAIGGPILIYQVAGVAASHGAQQFLAMAALVSLNLGLLNLLPVPLLDGGQASMVILEAVRRRPVSARTRERATWIGVALLFAILLLASRNDIMRHFLR